MEKVELTLSIEKMKLDALTYALSENGGDTPQSALEKRFKELYEQTVAPELRGYIDYMIAAQSPRPHSRRAAKAPATSAPGLRAAQAKAQEMHAEAQDEHG